MNGDDVTVERVLVYATIAQIAVMAIVGGLVWVNGRGREEGVRASDIAALDKAIHRLANTISGMPTHAALENLELRLELKLKTTEAAIAASAAHVASAAAATAAAIATRREMGV